MVATKPHFSRIATLPAPIIPVGPGGGDCPAAQHDANLVRRFQAGDDTAFNEIIVRHEKRTFAIALARLHSHTDAEEIVQDTFIRAHRALANFRGESSLATWLHRIAVNLSLNRYWYFFRRGRHMAQSLDQAIGDDNPSLLADTVASSAPGPVREAMAHEFIRIAADQMERLSPNMRDILRLRVVLNRSYAEIAALLGLNVGTVKSRIARARADLHALIAEACPDFAADALPAEWLGPLRAEAAS